MNANHSKPKPGQELKRETREQWAKRAPFWHEFNTEIGGGVRDGHEAGDDVFRAHEVGCGVYDALHTSSGQWRSRVLR